MMTLITDTAGAPAHRHNDTPKKRACSKPLTDEEVSRAVRAWEVKLMLEEMHDFGLRPPRGLTTALDLFIDGRATVTAIQAYLDQQLSAPMSSLSVEIHHA
jgi:hypothetical protein